MSSWMGPNTPACNSGYVIFAKTTDMVQPGSANSIVFIDERCDNIDDGYFEIDMVNSQLANLPASYHNGASGVTFADGHAEIHKWHDAKTLPPIKTVFQKFVPVSSDSVDLLWLRNHATTKQ